MEREEVKKTIRKLLNLLIQGKVEVNVMFVDQNNQRKRRYIGYMLKTQLSDITKVVKKSLDYLLEELDRRSLDNYDLEISVDDSLQMVCEEEVIYGKDILDEMSIEYTKDNTVSEDTNLLRIKFIVIQIFYAKDKSIYLYKKYVQPTAAYNTAEKYIFSGGILKPFEKDIITISSVVDAFLLGDYYYVLNRNSFNSIFCYKDVYKRILDINQGMISNSGLLSDASKFISDCEGDGRYLTRLAKAILAKGFEEVSKKKAEIPAVINDFNLSLQVDANGKIVYRGKEDIPELLNLLLRHYVIDALTSNKMIATAIQEYQAVKEDIS